jgi:hypothetical protein
VPALRVALEDAAGGERARRDKGGRQRLHAIIRSDC